MALGLDERGHHLALVDEVLDLCRVEVRDADGAQLARPVSVLELPVSGDVVAGRLVQDHEVDVVSAQALERLVHGGVAPVEGRPQLRLQEDVLARFGGGPHAPPHAALVDIDVGGVDELVAVVQGEGDGRLGLVGGELVGAKADEGHLDAVVQGDVVHCCLPSSSVVSLARSGGRPKTCAHLDHGAAASVCPAAQHVKCLCQLSGNV